MIVSERLVKEVRDHALMLDILYTKANISDSDSEEYVFVHIEDLSSQLAHHSLHITAWALQLMHHSLCITAWTLQHAHHNLHITAYAPQLVHNSLSITVITSAQGNI